MEIDINDLAQKVDKLRADLSATTTALAATTTALSPEQRQQVLNALAMASAKRQAIYEQLPIAAEKQRVTVRLLQESEARVYELLQGAPKALASR